MEQNKLLGADVALLSTQVIWGLAFIFVKASLHIIHPVTLLGIEFTLAAIILGTYLVITKKPLFTNLKQGLILGSLMCVGYISQTIGVSTITATNSAFITSLSIVLVPFLGFLFFKKKIGLKNSLAITVALVGIWILTGGVQYFSFGDFLTLSTALAFALHILCVDKFVSQDINLLVLNFQQLALVGLVCLLAVACFKLPINVGHASVIWTIIYLVLLANIYGHLVQTYGQKHTTAIRVAIIFSLEPVFTAIFAWLTHSEPFAWTTVLGGALVVIGLIISEARI